MTDVTVNTELFNVPLADLLVMEEQTYVLRTIKELMATNPVCKCHEGPLVIAVLASPPHWQKLICNRCGHFFKWVKHITKRARRDQTTTGLVVGSFCMICLCSGDTVPLQCHHILPVQSGGGNEDSNLLTVCDSCHELIHWRQRSVNRLTGRPSC